MSKLLLLLLLLLPLELAAQVTLSGTIREQRTGEVIIAASVVLTPDSASGAKARGAVSNKYGFYSLPRLAAGSYRLRVKALGYRTLDSSITIADANVKLDLELFQEDVRGQEVVVEADREASPTRSISSITVPTEIVQQLPSLGGEQDLFRVLQLLPGVKAASEISSGLYVRGGSPDQNLNLLDGVIVYNPSHLGGFLSTFNADALQDIRLIKGAFPAEYGGRLSSVLDITMKEGSKEKIGGTAGIGLITSRITLEGPISDKSTFMLSGRRMYLDAIVWLADALVKDDPNNNYEIPNYYFYDLKGKTNYILGDYDRVYLSGYFGRDVFLYPLSEDNEVSSDVSWGNSTANLRWTHIFSPELFTNFSGIFTRYDFTALVEDTDTNYEGGDFKSVSGITDLMLRGEAQYFPSEAHTIKTGLEITNHRFRADATVNFDEFGKIDQTPTIHRSLDVSLYAQDEWKYGANWAGNFGGRLYWFEKGNYFRAEPRLSLSYAFDDNMKAKAAFSMGNQFLHMVVRNDIALPTDVWFPSTETVKPGEATQYVLGLETYLFDKEYVLSAEAYYKSMNNLYEYKDTATLSLAVPLEGSFARGSGEAYGFELFLNKRIGSFTGWLGYTLSWTHRTFDELNRGKTFYPRYDRRHDLSAVLTYRLGESWEFSASWVYGTGQAYTVPSGQYSFPYDDIQGNFVSYDNYEELDYTERNGYRIPAFHKLDLNFT
ncbi:MAG TPA: TonB-dependent receptor, partial [Candidatus Kapabacteria bacterium]|nr:TonB-dependent receptor [Candidatus Kapabacteria bacterium]